MRIGLPADSQSDATVGGKSARCGFDTVWITGDFA
jgi:hypothetical protein